MLKAVFFFAKEFGPMPVCSIVNDITHFVLVFRRRGIDDDDRDYDEFGLHWHPILPHYHELDIIHDCCSPPRFDKLSLKETCLWNRQDLPADCMPLFTRTHCSFYHRFVRLYHESDDVYKVAFFDSSIFYDVYAAMNSHTCSRVKTIKKSFALTL